VILIVLENHSYGDVANASPYFNALARRCGLARNYAAVGHPSLPNYLALTSGTTAGIASDCVDCALDGRSLFQQLGRGWRSYEESMPSPGFRGAGSGLYAKKHNPAAYFTRIATAYERQDVPLGTPASGPLAADLRRNRLARFSLITPNLCNDEHDCPIATGDGWLRRWLPTILGSTAYRAGHTAVFVTYDEGTGSDNNVYTVVVSPSTPPISSDAGFTHYSLLRTIEQLLALPCLGDACHASSMRRVFHL
jgi:phospholipase C